RSDSRGRQRAGEFPAPPEFAADPSAVCRCGSGRYRRQYSFSDPGASRAGPSGDGGRAAPGRDFGLILFLAAVGLRAGDPFFRTLAHGSGWFWMASGALVTFVPLLFGAIIARARFKVNYLSLCGFLAGSMNSPTLAFAN